MVEIKIIGNAIWGFVMMNGEQYGRGGYFKGPMPMIEEDALYVVDRLRKEVCLPKH